MDRLVLGMLVEVPGVGEAGEITSVAHEGLMGLVTCRSGALFTVFSSECREVGELVEELDGLFYEAVRPSNYGGKVWK